MTPKEEFESEVSKQVLPFQNGFERDPNKPLGSRLVAYNAVTAVAVLRGGYHQVICRHTQGPIGHKKRALEVTTEQEVLDFFVSDLPQLDSEIL